MDLERARAAAHEQGGKVNDVVLAVIAGGLTELLRERGEQAPPDGIIAAIAVNLREPATSAEGGNVVGALRVHLPLGIDDAEDLLRTVVQRTRAAKAAQRISRGSSSFVLGLVGWLASHGYSFADQQRMINVFVSDVPGPTAPLRALGAEVEDVLPIVGLFGNETLSFIALSYHGQFNLVTVADRSACPDVDVLAHGMATTWAAITGCCPDGAVGSAREGSAAAVPRLMQEG